MQVQIHGTPSYSDGGRRAQVTVLVGEGSSRRSITRHVQKRPCGNGSFGWFGLNIDPRAIPLNELYEQKLAEAKGNLASAKAALDELKKKLEIANEAKPGRIHSKRRGCCRQDRVRSCDWTNRV